MAMNTKIEYVDASWDPWRGCTEVSPGCANCYARELATRNPAVFGSWGKGQPRVKSKGWFQPIAWNRKAAQAAMEYVNRHGGSLREAFRPESLPPAPEPPWIFPSKCDWLDEEVPIEWLGQFLDLICATPNLRWLLLTKRPQNWMDRMVSAGRWAVGQGKVGAGMVGDMIEGWIHGQPPANVWLGTSVEDQTRANDRIPILLSTPAALRFLSVEPLLGPVDLSEWILGRKIGWVIVGGESGRLARTCKVDWVRSIVCQCSLANVPAFVKQLGANTYVQPPNGPVTHPKGGDPSEWPSDLRVRQFPEERR